MEELAEERELTLLSARFEGFDERIVEHVATDSVSIGPYVLSGGELPGDGVLDAIARRLPGALREESGADESFSEALEGGLEYPHYTRPAEFRGWRVPTCSSRATTRASTTGGASRAARGRRVVRGPIDRLTERLPRHWRTAADWVITIVVAVGAVLAIKAWVVNPYRIPSSSMEPTLHCAEPGDGCQSPLLGPRAREPLHLPLPGPGAATSSSSRPRRRRGRAAAPAARS